MLTSLRSLITAAYLTLAATAAFADDPTAHDPRNWPTVTRLIADRYELAGQVLTVRAYAKRSDSFNCRYTGQEDALMAFTLAGGPFETLTGYMPRELGKVLERVIASSPDGAPVQITVQIAFNPQKLSEICIDQVDILKWSRGWVYPPHTLAPTRPTSAELPTPDRLREVAQVQLWKDLVDSETPTVGQQVQLSGGVRLSNAMHCAMRGAWRTHWALQLHDGRGRTLHAYLPKSDKNRALVDHLALTRDAVVTLQGRVVKAAMSSYCPPQLDISGWTLLAPSVSAKPEK